MTRLNSSVKYYLYSKCKRWKSTRCGILIMSAMIVVFINEYLFYRWAEYRWTNIDELAKKSTVEKILLVADPQLIGEKDEFYFGFVKRNDADRYLSKTFHKVNAYVQPDWVVYLGDIFDEGLSADDQEFKRYFERFNKIFHYENHGQRAIVIPGDNDVGGEYYGDKQPILRERFQNYFGRVIALYHQNNVQFLKLDIDLSDSYIEGKRSTILERLQNRPMSASFRIVLNHWPILARTNRFVKPFINDLEPNLILKGDSHHFEIISYDRTTMMNQVIAQEYLTKSIYSLDLTSKNFVYEISVPTCSYRMGVERIGYMVLLLDSETKTAHLTILWTPKRYIALYIYITYLVIAVFLWILTSLFSRRTLVQIFKFYTRY